MSEKPASPFARLDTSLLRSTKPTDPPSALPPTQETVAPVAARPPRQQRREPMRGTTAARDHGPTTDATVSPTTPRHHDTTTPRESEDMIDVVRKVVKANGKEGATLRLTAAEKQQLKDMVYSYGRQGKRTSETELIRIATNYMLEDYRRNGAHSVVARVIAALDS